MDTRTKLLIAAERLYALYGQEGATSRMIVAEAKQRNASALTYHFATRSELMEAICKFRMEPINNDRIQQILEYLAKLPEPADRLRSLIRISYLPSVGPIIAAKGKSYFRRFLAQAITNPSAKFSSIIDGKFDAGLRQTSALICREVPHLPKAVAVKRVTTMYRSISYLTAHLEARCAVGAWKDRKAELDVELELMIDGFTGFMQAPHSAVLPAKAATLAHEDSERELQNALL
jgi:AcrR family transcriptional regulator